MRRACIILVCVLWVCGSSVSIAGAASSTTVYLPLTAQPSEGTRVGPTALYVISSKIPGSSPIRVFAGATKPAGYAHALTIDSTGRVQQGEPHTLAFSSSGAAGGDYLYALDLTADSSLSPVQIGSLRFPSTESPVQNCGILQAYGNLTEPSSAFFIIALPTNEALTCAGGSSSFTYYLVHLTDTPSTPPIKLAMVSFPMVALYHTNGQLSGFLMVDASRRLDFCPGENFQKRTVLLSGVNDFGTLQAPLSLFTQTTANPTFSFLAVQSVGGSSSLYRVDDAGKLSADLYDFQGDYDAGVLIDTANVYITDSYGTDDMLIERILQVPLDGSASAKILFQYRSTNTEPYYPVGSTATRLVLWKSILNSANDTISEQLATLPLDTPAKPTVIANFSNLFGVETTAEDILLTESTNTGSEGNPTFVYSTEIIQPDGKTVQPVRKNAAFLFLPSQPLLEVTGITASHGYGGGTVSQLNLSNPSSPTSTPLRGPKGNAFTVPTGSDFVFNYTVTPTLGFINALGDTNTYQFIYDRSNQTIVSVSVPDAQLSLVESPTQ